MNLPSHPLDLLPLLLVLACDPAPTDKPAGSDTDSGTATDSGAGLDTRGPADTGSETGQDSTVDTSADTGAEPCVPTDEVPYDGVDQDCDGLDLTDVDADGYDAAEVGGADCDDLDDAVHPDALEHLDDVDDDCDGEVDDVITVRSSYDWAATATYEVDWTEPGFDDSAWGTAYAPAPEDCGWLYNEGNLGRPFEWWEHDDVPTMWEPTSGDDTYYRLLINVPDADALLQAMITTVSDDDHELYVNGTLAASDADGGAGPVVETDITSLLVTGDNVLAVRGRNSAGGCAWLAVDGTIQ